MGDSRPTPSSNPQTGGKTLAGRAGLIQPFKVMELSARAAHYERAGENVVHFQVGEPDFSTCAPIIEAGQAALAGGHTKYSDACGIPALREAIAADYTERLGVAVPAEAILVTPGASGALTMLLGALFNAEQELLLADPGYPCNSAFAHLVGALPRLLPTTAATEYQLSAQAVDSAWNPQTRGVLVASPANPTGGMLGRKALEALVGVIQRRRGVLLMDEIYSGLVYERADDSYHTGWEVSREMFLVNSFSKYFGMTGWRLGWIVAPQWAHDALNRLAQNLFISPSTPAQWAALAAFQPAALAEHERRRKVYQRRRDLLLGGLQQLGLQIPFTPKGGFFLYVDISSTGMDAETFCWRLIEEYKVAVTPGTDFGNNASSTHVRFAFTTAEEQIVLGIERIQSALQAWRYN